MTSIAILGATGNLGRHIADQALARGWSLAVAVRNRSKLAAEVAQQAQVTDLDLDLATLTEIAAFAAGRDILVCCAGYVAQGDAFVRLFDKVVSAVESLPSEHRPVCWFLAGAALLSLDAGGRRGVDLPKVRDIYWPHQKNFERLLRSDIDWRLLCPGQWWISRRLDWSACASRLMPCRPPCRPSRTLCPPSWCCPCSP